jgi:hypothetical protein
VSPHGPIAVNHRGFLISGESRAMFSKNHRFIDRPASPFHSQTELEVFASCTSDQQRKQLRTGTLSPENNLDTYACNVELGSNVIDISDWQWENHFLSIISTDAGM